MVLGARSFGNRGFGDSTGQTRAAGASTTPSSTDSGVVTDSSLITVFASDGGSGSEAFYLTVFASDGGTGSESQNAPGGIYGLTSSDAGTGSASESIQSAIGGADSSVGSSSQSIGLGAGDSGSQGGSTQVSLGTTDAGTESESSSVFSGQVIRSSDAGTVSDVGYLHLAKSVRLRGSTVNPQVLTPAGIDKGQYNSIRHRQGRAVPAPLLVSRRTRAGTVVVVLHKNAQASGSRTRRSIAYPVVTTPSVISGPGGTGTGTGGTTGSGGTGTLPVNIGRRWRLDDPIDGSSYIFENNPNSSLNGALKVETTVELTTAPDGNPLIFQGESEYTGEFTGTLHSKAQYDQFVSWFVKQRTLQLTDDLGRVTHLMMTQFSTKRKSSRHFPYRMDFTIRYLILEQVNV